MYRLLQKTPPYAFTIVVIAAILYLTLVPKPLPETDLPLIPHLDKVVHACMFGGLVFVISLDYRRSRRHPVLTAGTMTLFCTLSIIFGGIIELLQGWMEMGRGCDIYDFIADSAGAILSSLISPVIIRRLLTDRH